MSMLTEEEREKRDNEPREWGESKTIQSQEAETNINNIMQRFQKTGELTHVSRAIAKYRDMTDIPDLEGAMNIVADAQSTFELMPAAVRKACQHDVKNFLPFIDDPANLEQCIALHILPPQMEEEELPLEPEAKIVPTPPTPADPPEE